VAGLVLVSYPLHPPKKPDKLRIEHLPQLRTQTLCISGTRDDFGSPDELATAFAVVPAEVQWQWVENARHELARKDDVVAELAAQWITSL
jgi:predicted alpha/beta-hydrolase family hydrolase